MVNEDRRRRDQEGRNEEGKRGRWVVEGLTREMEEPRRMKIGRRRDVKGK